MKIHKLLRISHPILSLALIALLGSCSKDEEKPDLQDGKSIVVSDLAGDIGNTVGSGKPFAPVFFSFSTNAIVDSSRKQSADWDIAFAREYNSYLSVNNGSSSASFGSGGPGRGALLVVNQNYNNVSTAPSDEEFTRNGIDAAGWDSGNGNGWYFYDLNTHIAVPIKNRTYILRTADGKYAKLELVSMYRGAPSVVTDLDWPAPYLTFRYFVQQDGSRNLSTKDQ